MRLSNIASGYGCNCPSLKGRRSACVAHEGPTSFKGKKHGDKVTADGADSL